MKRCPTCHANYDGKPVCRRCGTELDRIARLEQESIEHEEKAKAEFDRKNYPGMFYHARRACAIRRTPQNVKLFACSAVLTGHYDLAIGQWRSIRTI